MLFRSRIARSAAGLDQTGTQSGLVRLAGRPPDTSDGLPSTDAVVLVTAEAYEKAFSAGWDKRDFPGWHGSPGTLAENNKLTYARSGCLPVPTALLSRIQQQGNDR